MRLRGRLPYIRNGEWRGGFVPRFLLNKIGTDLPDESFYNWRREKIDFALAVNHVAFYNENEKENEFYVVGKRRYP
ncbi:hypothetical protein SAMN06264849_102155 [Melghirimyces algeriensis]|uniref:Uncharacterized protein n=1 Tax=Melghirimyces algeriensis TaxID=910412 RepID=A0A521BK73_9BACL|nr:hypothetical protein SAMN06264849_102155 [Melghirimyces algeriensis]